MCQMTIGEVARRTSTPASTLRYYESIGLLPEPKRSNGRRFYEPAVLRQVSAIRRAQEAGWTLPEIKELSHGFSGAAALSERWQQMATKKNEELDAIIRRAEHAKELLRIGSECGCSSLESCEILEREV